MDSLLPAEQRYTSMKFRRAAPRLYLNRLDFDDAAELVAFSETIGHKATKWVFHWPTRDLGKMQELREHMLGFPVVHQMIAENNEAPTRADGLAVLRAMQDGGWKQGGVPPVVRLALLDMRDEGIAQARIGEMLGLTHDQVRVMANGMRRPRRVGAGVAGLWAD